MKIIDSNLQMEGRALAWEHTRRSEQVSIRIGLPANAEPAAPRATLADISDDALAIDQAAPSLDGENDTLDPRLRMLIAIIEAMTGRRIALFDGKHLQATPTAPGSGPAQGSAAQGGDALVWSVRIETSHVRESLEASHFAASGSVRTADGREIDFSLQMAMMRYEREEFSSVLEFGNAPRLTDPLVLNLATDQVRLRAGSFSFDLNLDGQADQLAQLGSGSAYLALDRNGNGQIDDGRELFGPRSGNGFSELAELDDDGNGWIDEADAAFAQLRLWRPGEGLQTLAEAGVGAIALMHASTPFQLKAAGETLGAVRSSGVFLTEAGEVRSVQQIDLAV